VAVWVQVRVWTRVERACWRRGVSRRVELMYVLEYGPYLVSCALLPYAHPSLMVPVLAVVSSQAVLVPVRPDQGLLDPSQAETSYSPVMVASSRPCSVQAHS